MSLFVDGPELSVDLLTKYDANVLEVSTAEGINLSDKIALAHDSIHMELERLMKRSAPGWSLWYLYQTRGVENVVWSKGLVSWNAQEALALIYRDAYYSQLNDRHKARADHYAALAAQARRNLVESGLDVVSHPLRRPGQPVVAMVPAGETGGTFYFSISVANAQGQESSGSSLLSVDVLDGNAADLTLPGVMSGEVTGWNLYAGTAPDQLYRQNEAPIPVESDWCYLPSIAVVSGTGLPGGQTADQHWPLHQFRQRG